VLDFLRRDVRFGLRAIGRNPLFALVAVVSIGVGVGATTAIVTLANTLLLQPPPGVGNAERVVTVGRTQEGQGFDNFSYPNYLDYRAAATTLSGFAAMRLEPQPMSLAGPAGGEAIESGWVTGNFFDVLQAHPALGRFFHADEDSPVAAPVVVLNHAFWRNRFAADPGVVGQKVVLNGTPFTVVGVAAEGFHGPFVLSPDVWVPLHATAVNDRGLFTQRSAVWLMGIARLAPGATLGAVQSQLNTITASLLREYPRANEGKGMRVAPASLFPGEMRGIVGGFLGVLFALAALVLIVASTNVAGMLLARAAARRREIAVRLAIGASRMQLIRQLVVESVLLFVAAGIAGIGLAQLLVNALMGMVPRLPVQLAFDPKVDSVVLAFALGASLLTGFAAGLIPAIQSTNPALVHALKLDAASSGGRRQRLRSALLVSQIAFSMLLLIVGGLFGRSLLSARAIDTGFETKGIEIASLNLDIANHDSVAQPRIARAILEGAVAIPGVRHAAFSVMLPLDGGGMGLGGIEVDGRSAPDERNGWAMDWNVVTPDYFETLGIPIAAGRPFSDIDNAGAPEAAILNETFARALFPEGDALGRTMRNGDRTLTVVGIARDARYRTLGESPRNFVYVNLAQRPMGRLHLLTRSDAGVSVAREVRRLVQRVDPNLPILDQRTMEDQAALSLFPQRIAVWMAGGLGAVAFLLALLGVYGVTAYAVAQRTREIGVRVALGAMRGQVLWLVVRQGLLLAGVGVIIGGIAAAGVTRLLSSLLYGIHATDAIAFAGAAVLLTMAALAASWIPARRAAAINPVTALRAE